MNTPESSRDWITPESAHRECGFPAKPFKGDFVVTGQQIWRCNGALWHRENAYPLDNTVTIITSDTTKTPLPQRIRGVR